MVDASEQNGGISYRASSPWWWNVLNLLATKPSVIAALIGAFLVWWLVAVQDRKLDQLLAMAAEARAVDAQVLAKIGEHVQNDVRYQKASIELQSETCLQQANTTAAAIKCSDVPRKFIEGQ